jgi:hypothetical protein
MCEIILNKSIFQVIKMTIQQDLARCIQDTNNYISHQAANRLKPWIDYPIQQLITSIRNAINAPNNRINGWEINRNGGISLEHIVIKYEELFTDNDKHIARQTLGG